MFWFMPTPVAIPDTAVAFVLAAASAAGLVALTPWPWRCRCGRCGREVQPRYNSIQQGGGGCKFCAGVFVDAADARRWAGTARVLPRCQCSLAVSRRKMRARRITPLHLGAPRRQRHCELF